MLSQSYVIIEKEDGNYYAKGYSPWLMAQINLSLTYDNKQELANSIYDEVQNQKDLARINKSYSKLSKEAYLIKISLDKKLYYFSTKSNRFKLFKPKEFSSCVKTC